MHISPSRVSHAIKKQERPIGAPLFERTSRTVRLTPVGRQLRDDLLPAHVQIQQAVGRAVANARGFTGALRIGYSTPWCADLVFEAAEAFRGRYAGCTVRIQEIQFDDPYGLLRRGELDLHVGEVPVAEPGIAAGPVLLREPRALMVPADHPLARRDSVSLEDLAGVPMIIPGGNVPKALLDIHVPTRTPRGRHIPRGPSYTFWPEVPSLVAAGLGVSVVAARAARYHDRPGIAFVPFRDGPTLDYGVLWRTAGQAPSVPLAFVGFLRDLSHTTETTSSSVGSPCARRWAQTSSSMDARRSGHSLSAVLSGGVTAVPGPAAPAHGTPPGIRTDRGPAGVLPRAVCVLSEDPGDPS